MSDPILFQTIVTLTPPELKDHKQEMRDGVLTLTARNLSFVQKHNKIAQAIPSIVVIGLAIGFVVRALSGSLPLDSPSVLTFSWAAAIGMTIYAVHRLYQIYTSPMLAYQLDIPLVSIAQIAEERLRFTKHRRLLQITTYDHKVHRFATLTEIAEWARVIGEGLEVSYGRSLQFRQDGDFPTWRVAG
ncbi:MAG: hypothetical protein H6658_14385 [Ardenticatenaceae bacterium]|nr:hypothetical protein [Ardenticatenaceae bacterium]